MPCRRGTTDDADQIARAPMLTQFAVDDTYLAQRPYFGNFAHSSPVFLAIGNHENEEGWNFDDTFSLALGGIEGRKEFYPTPAPDPLDDFYSANSDPHPSVSCDGYREDYYAFEWGDAPPVAGAGVSGTFRRGEVGECTTDAAGTCDIELLTSGRGQRYVVESVTHASLSYDPAANGDPDGDSDGTSIVIDAP